MKRLKAFAVITVWFLLFVFIFTGIKKERLKQQNASIVSADETVNTEYSDEDYANEETSSEDSESEITEDTVDFVEMPELNFEELSTRYATGKWSGNFLAEGNHCYEISNGTVWIDCVDTKQSVDQKDEYNTVLCKLNDGTYVINDSTNQLERWVLGVKEETFELPEDIDTYYFYFLGTLENSMLFQYGSTLYAFDCTSKEFTALLSNIIEARIENKTLYWCDVTNQIFESKKVALNELTVSSGMHLPSEKAFPDANEDIFQKYHKLYSSGNWDGSFMRDGNEFALVESNILIVNNREIGYIQLDTSRVTKDCVFNDYDGTAYVDNNKQTISYFEYGKKVISAKLSKGDCSLLYWDDFYDDTVEAYISPEAVIRSGNAIYRLTKKGFELICSDAIDSNATSNTLYWMDSNHTIYSVDWRNSLESTLFIEDACAISPSDGEAQGALVKDLSLVNYSAEGFDVYSPYGIY